MTRLIKNEAQPTQYDLGYRVLHWLMAAMILLMFMAGMGFANAVTEQEHMTMLIGHSSIGTVMSLLLIIRITKRFVVRSKRPVHELPQRQKAMAKSVQLGLYLCMVVIPVSGYLTANLHTLPVMLFGVFQLNSNNGVLSESAFQQMRVIHESAILCLSVLLILHIGGALYHKFIKKDKVMNSMTRGRA